MELKLLGETLLLTIFWHYKARENKKIIKSSFLKTTRKFLPWLWTLRRRMSHTCGFWDCFSFSHFFGYFICLLEHKAKFIKFCLSFWIKQVTFLSSRCNAFLQRSKPVPPNSLRFFKIKKAGRALRVNGTKVT